MDTSEIYTRSSSGRVSKTKLIQKRFDHSKIFIPTLTTLKIIFIPNAYDYSVKQ